MEGEPGERAGGHCTCNVQGWLLVVCQMPTAVLPSPPQTTAAISWSVWPRQSAPGPCTALFPQTCVRKAPRVILRPLSFSFILRPACTFGYFDSVNNATDVAYHTLPLGVGETMKVHSMPTCSTRRDGVIGPHALSAEGSGQQRPYKTPRHNQHNPRYANYWAPRTRRQHHKKHMPQRPSEHSDLTQHAKGRPGECPGPCREHNVSDEMPRLLGPVRGPADAEPTLVLSSL